MTDIARQAPWARQALVAMDLSERRTRVHAPESAWNRAKQIMLGQGVVLIGGGLSATHRAVSCCGCSASAGEATSGPSDQKPLASPRRCCHRLAFSVNAAMPSPPSPSGTCQAPLTAAVNPAD